MSEMLKESVFREKKYMYSVFHSSNGEEEAVKEEKKKRKQEEKAVLNRNQIIPYLGDLSRTASGLSYAYLSVNLSNQSLTSVRGLDTYSSLQHIDVSHNQIYSLKPLSAMRALQRLDASHNRVECLLDFTPPDSLVHADLSHNSIQTIPSLSGHRFLTTLVLSHNNITQIQGLSKNVNLKVLDLQHNQIECIDGLDHLNLTDLNLSANRLSSLSGLENLASLRKLDLSQNQIAKLKGLEELGQLRTLVLTVNKVKNVREIDRIQCLQLLSVVDLCFNPIQHRKYYRLQVLFRLPQLNTLDGQPITPIEQTKSENLYAQDQEDRKRIFSQLVPEEEFIDRRINLKEVIDPETDSDIEQVDFVDKYDQKGQYLLKNKSKGAKHKAMDMTGQSSFNATETIKQWKQQPNQTQNEQSRSGNTSKNKNLYMTIN